MRTFIEILGGISAAMSTLVLMCALTVPFCMSIPMVLFGTVGVVVSVCGIVALVKEGKQCTTKN